MANVWHEKDGKKYRVCWRNEATADAPGVREKKSKTVSSIKIRDDLVAKIREQLELHGVYVHEAPARRRVADLEAAAEAWVEHRKARHAAAGTVDSYDYAVLRCGRDIRALEGIGDDQPIPITVLSRGLFTRLLVVWQSHDLGEARQAAVAQTLLSVWRFAADDPAEWPGTPVPPFDASTVVPPTPKRRRAPPAPTVAECDAICRRAAAETGDLRDIVATMRLTGLRTKQVLSIRVRHIDVRANTLHIPPKSGKSKQEKDNPRTMAIHTQLLGVIGLRLEGKKPGDLIFPRHPRFGSEGLRSSPAGEVKALWEAATEAGEVRREVWAPVTFTKKTRPDHAFRAAFLAALKAAKVERDTRGFFVGHAPEGVEGEAYAGPEMAEQIDALTKLPNIEWGWKPHLVASG